MPYQEESRRPLPFDYEESLSLPLNDYNRSIVDAFRREFSSELLHFRMPLFDNGMPLPLTESSQRVIHLAWINGDNIKDSLFEISAVGHALTNNADIAGTNTQELGILFPFIDLRQDKRTRKRIPDTVSDERAIVSGQGVTVDLIAKTIKHVAGASYVITFDAHSHDAVKLFEDNGLEVINIQPAALFAQEMKTSEMLNDSLETVIATTDFGSLNRAVGMQKFLDFPIVIIGKERFALGDGTNSETMQHMLFGDVKDKRIILSDDMCSSGKTIRHAVDLALEEGAKEIIICFTHGVFVKDYYEELQEILKKPEVVAMMTTDSLPFQKSWGMHGLYAVVDQIKNGHIEPIRKSLTVIPVGEFLAKKARVIMDANSLTEAKTLLGSDVLDLKDPYELIKEMTALNIVPPSVTGIYREGGSIYRFGGITFF